MYLLKFSLASEPGMYGFYGHTKPCVYVQDLKGNFKGGETSTDMSLLNGVDRIWLCTRDENNLIKKERVVELTELKALRN